MKNFCYTILFVLGSTYFVSAQVADGTLVKGLIPIPRIFSAVKSTNDESVFSISNEMESKQMLSVTPTGSSTEVGITEGQLSVSLTGGAIYSIPIVTPPGINGIVPQLGLSYNSQSGNGLVGFGWNITGVSSISKVPSTKFHDEVIDPVDYDELDRFAFDGQRLVAKNGNVYGANETVYETESFSNLKITSFGVHPNGIKYGPAYFIVEYPDGSKANYGYSSNSRSMTDWSISYWENPQGVRISYTYILANNNLSVQFVRYGSIASNAPINEVEFIYKARQISEQAYVGGQSFVRSTILSDIQVRGNGVSFRSYLLEHNMSSLGYERLVKIFEKAGDNTRSYNPTVFNYETTSEAITYNQRTADLSVTNISSQNAVTVSGDFDGDGKLDFLLYPKSGPDVKSKYWIFTDIASASSLNFGWRHDVGYFEDIFPVSWLNGSNKLMPMQGWTIQKELNDNEGLGIGKKFITYASSGTGIYEQFTRVVNFPNANISNCDENCQEIYTEQGILKKFLSGDFDGDGITDVIAIEQPLGMTSGGCYQYYDEYGSLACENNGVYYTEAYKRVYYVDLDNSNTTNFLQQIGMLQDVLGNTSKIEVADVNGDGKSDFLIFDIGKVTAYTMSSGNQLEILWTTFDGNIVLNKRILLGDYNGDGKIDFIIPKGAGFSEWYKYTSTGIGFVKQTQNYEGFYYPTDNALNIYNVIPTDYNNDGKTDLLVSKNGRNSSNTFGDITVTCYVNKNNTFSTISNNPYLGNSGQQTDLDIYSLPIFLTSTQANRKTEVAFINKNKIHYFQSQKDLNVERLLRNVTVGNGVVESITYKPLDISAVEGYDYVYASSNYTENYPNTDIVSSPTFQLVSKLEKQSESTYKKQLFGYYGAVSNVEGLGFLGFRSTMRTNWHDNSGTVLSTISMFDLSLRGANTVNFTMPYLMYPTSIINSSGYISKTISNYTSTLLTNKVFKLTLITSSQYNGLDDTSSETKTVLDEYNNPTQSTTTLKNNGAIEQTTTTNIGYENQPTGSTYYIGRPTSKNQTVTVNGDSMKNEEIYAYTNHLLSQIKKAGNDAGVYIVEDNLYDVFGNITKKTITAPGSTPRITSYTYDSSARFLNKSIDIEGLETIFTYNTNNGLLNSETNPYGLTTTYLYDSWFKKTKTIDYLGKSNTYSYTQNSSQTIVSTSGEDGSSSEETYDDLGRKIKSGVKNIEGNFSYIDYLYDSNDRNYKTSEPYIGGGPSQWSETQYDMYGRPTASISFTGKTVSMSYTGLSTTISESSKTKIITKNSIGNMVSMTETPGGTINYTYFANGNLKASNYDGVQTTLEQDGWGHKTKLTDPSAGVYTYAYNGFGETTRETSPNGTTTYTLNQFGKLTKKTIVGTNTNSETIYSYDGVSKLPISSVFKDIINGNIVTTNSFEYDSFKRLFKTTENTPFASFTKQISFDAFGRVDTEGRSGTTLGQTATKTTKNNYKNGVAWQILDVATSRVLWQTNSINARGQLTAASLGNGINITNTYDTYGYASEYKHDRTGTNPLNIMTLNTVFDAQKGNLTSRTNSLFNTNEVFEYDALDRLTKWPDTPVLLFNNSFDTTAEGFSEVSGATMVPNYQGTGVLSVSAANAYSGVQKVVLAGAAVGNKVKLKVDVSSTDLIRIIIIEEDPASGSWNQSFKSFANNGTVEFEHTVTQYPNVVLKIDKSEYSTYVGIPRDILIDNLKVQKLVENTQQYDNRGRINQNSLGTYNYSSSAKPYQNTSVSVNPEALAYYTARPTQNISYTAFKSPYEITQTTESATKEISFYYNDHNDRSTMVYGKITYALDGKPMIRHHYSADGSMEIIDDNGSGTTLTFITYIGGDAYSAPIIAKSTSGTEQNYL